MDLTISLTSLFLFSGSETPPKLAGEDACGTGGCSGLAASGEPKLSLIAFGVNSPVELDRPQMANFIRHDALSPLNIALLPLSTVIVEAYALERCLQELLGVNAR